MAAENGGHGGGLGRAWGKGRGGREDDREREEEDEGEGHVVGAALSSHRRASASSILVVDQATMRGTRRSLPS
jgi:hypothetical protein